MGLLDDMPLNNPVEKPKHCPPTQGHQNSDRSDTDDDLPGTCPHLLPVSMDIVGVLIPTLEPLRRLA